MTEVNRCRDVVVFRQLDDEWAVFDPEAMKIHTLNLTAAFVWSHLSADIDEDAIIQLIVHSFETPVPLEQARADVAAAIRQFRDEGLLA